MKRRFLSGLLAAACLFTLVSCGGDSSAEETSSSAEQSAESGYSSSVLEPTGQTEEQGESSSLPNAGSGSASEEGAQQETAVPVDKLEKSTFSIQFLDVGQADAALVECDGHYMLMDGGEKEDSNLVYAVLKREKVGELDIVVGTHAHEDHIGGLPGAFSYAPAKLTLCPTTDYDSEAFEDFKGYAVEKSGGIVVPSVGDTYSLGSAEVKILGVNGGSGTNNTSIVLMVTYGKTKFLFAGDAEREAEQAILNSGADLAATVLKVGHHGSDTSTTYPFLREIMPEYAVISVGKGNSYGHPTEDALSRLRDADVKVYRTDLQGDIRCTSDGETVAFSAEKNENADTLTPATKPEPVVVPSPTPKPEPAPVPVPEPTPTPVPAPEPSVPSGAYYVLNTSSKKFHHPDCGSVGKIGTENREYYEGTAEELVAKGYEPCGSCKPYEVSNPEPEPTPLPAPGEDAVWISGTGSKYHRKPNCSNMKSPAQVTKSQAQSRGLTPCKKCW